MSGEEDTPPRGTESLKRIGRRMSDVQQAQLSFLGAKDRILMWLIAGLISWLCYSTMIMRESMVLMLERSQTANEQIKILHNELERVTSSNTNQDKKINDLQLQQAAHGWKANGD